jgi:hypothetical protein
MLPCLVMQTKWPPQEKQGRKFRSQRQPSHGSRAQGMYSNPKYDFKSRRFFSSVLGYILYVSAVTEAFLGVGTFNRLGLSSKYKYCSVLLTFFTAFYYYFFSLISFLDSRI